MDEWATPTPYPTPSGLPEFTLGDTDGMFVTVAEQSVSTWQMANQNSFIDGLMGIVILIAVIAAFRNLRKDISEI